MEELTEDERRAVAALKRLAVKWPRSLWLMAGSGVLRVMKLNADGSRQMSEGGVSLTGEVDRVDIPSDGGDW